MNTLHTLGEAIAALKEGKTIYRQAWHNAKLTRIVPDSEEHFGYVEVLWRGMRGSWVPSSEDFVNDDWIIE